MRYKALAVTCALAVMIPGRAYADSVTQPGFTVGLPIYADTPTGLYLTNVPEIGVRNGDPDTQTFIYAPFFYFQTPIEVAKAKIAIAFSPVYIHTKVKNGPHVSGFFNTYGAVQATWKLADGWGAGVRAGGFIKQHNKISLPFAIFDARAGATYLRGGTHFTANFVYGHPLQGTIKTSPDYLNLDLTYARRKDKFEYGLGGFASTDVSRPFDAYRKQRQIALGPIVGYDFPGFSLQARVTSDVFQRNYGGKEVRFWSVISFPLWTPRKDSATDRVAPDLR